MRKKASSCPVAWQQKGVALIMALVMLVIVTLIGLAGIRETVLQERMAGNLYDRAIAMQSAEFAMAAAEKYLYETARSTVRGNSKITDCTVDGANCKGVPDANSANWIDIPLGSFNEDLQASGNAQYHIQYMGLKSGMAATDTSQSASPPQYGSTGGGSSAMNMTQNAIYLVTARSSEPTDDRAVVVLSALLRSN